MCEPRREAFTPKEPHADLLLGWGADPGGTGLAPCSRERARLVAGREAGVCVCVRVCIWGAFRAGYTEDLGRQF